MWSKDRENQAHTIRFYFKGTAGIHELTSEEIVKSIRESKDEAYLRDVTECFMLCDRVKFAQYEPDAQDFKRVVGHARRIIK